MTVKEILNVSCRHPFLGDQVEHDARVDLTRARSHREPVESGEAHRAFDASPAAERAHRRAAAEMSNNDPSLRNLRRNLRQGLRDVFVRQAMKAIATHAFGMKPMRDRVVVSDRAMCAVKAGVETGDLRQ